VELPNQGKRGHTARRDGQPIQQHEKHFTQKVVDLARLLGYSVYHTYWSEHSAAGWPDLVLCKPPRLIFAELKVKAIVKPAQQRWLDDLRACGQETYVWRYPADWDAIVRLLQGGLA
jgi:hypothetical protein